MRWWHRTVHTTLTIARSAGTVGTTATYSDRRILVLHRRIAFRWRRCILVQNAVDGSQWI